MSPLLRWMYTAPRSWMHLPVAALALALLGSGEGAGGQEVEGATARSRPAQGTTARTAACAPEETPPRYFSLSYFDFEAYRSGGRRAGKPERTPAAHRSSAERRPTEPCTAERPVLANHSGRPLRECVSAQDAPPRAG